MPERQKPDKESEQEFPRTAPDIDRAEIMRQSAERENRLNQLLDSLPDQLNQERAPSDWNQLQIEAYDQVAGSLYRDYSLSEIATLITLINKHPDLTTQGNPDLSPDDLEKRQMFVKLVSKLISSNLIEEELDLNEQLDQLKELDIHNYFHAALTLKKNYSHLPRNLYRTIEGIAFQEDDQPIVWLEDETSFRSPVNLETPEGKLTLAVGKKMFFGHFKGDGFEVHLTAEEARQAEPINSLVLYAALIDFINVIEELKIDSEKYSDGIIMGITPNPNLVDLCKKQLGFKEVINIRKLIRNSILNLNILDGLKLGVIRKMITNTVLLSTLSRSKEGKKSQTTSEKKSSTIAVSIDDLIAREPSLLRFFALLNQRVSRNHSELAKIMQARPGTQRVLELASIYSKANQDENTL